MPGKSRRVAARQSQLSRKRRKQQRGPSGTPSPGPVPAETDGRPSSTVVTQPQQPVASEPTTPAPVAPSAVPARPSPVSPPRTTSRARGERPDAYNYVGPEFRRILVMAGTVLVALAVLGFLL